MGARVPLLQERPDSQHQVPHPRQEVLAGATSRSSRAGLKAQPETLLALLCPALNLSPSPGCRRGVKRAAAWARDSLCAPLCAPDSPPPPPSPAPLPLLPLPYPASPALLPCPVSLGCSVFPDRSRAPKRSCTALTTSGMQTRSPSWRGRSTSSRSSRPASGTLSASLTAPRQRSPGRGCLHQRR